MSIGAQVIHAGGRAIDRDGRAVVRMNGQLRVRTGRREHTAKYLRVIRGAGIKGGIPAVGDLLPKGVLGRDGRGVGERQRPQRSRGEATRCQPEPGDDAHQHTPVPNPHPRFHCFSDIRTRSTNTLLLWRNNPRDISHYRHARFSSNAPEKISCQCGGVPDPKSPLSTGADAGTIRCALPDGRTGHQPWHAGSNRIVGSIHFR